MKAEAWLVTGARKGIGRYLADAYMKEGKTVIGCSRKVPDSHLCKEFYACDVSYENEVKELFYKIRQSYRLTNVIHCAGMGGMNPVITTPVALVRQILEVNVVGTFLVCREAAKTMLSRGGSIFTFSSIVDELPMEGEAVYGASKSAVTNFSLALAQEMKRFNVFVNVIQPGPVEGIGMFETLPEEIKNKALSRFHIEQPTKPESIKWVIDNILQHCETGKVADI